MLQCPAFFQLWCSGQGSLPVLYYCFTGRVSQLEEEIFSKGYKPEAMFKRLNAFPKLCSPIPLPKGQTLPLTLTSSHPGWHLHQTLFCLLKLKLVSQELYNQAVESIINQGKELAWWEVGEKGQQHLKTSDIPLIDNSLERKLHYFQPHWVPLPSLSHCHQFLQSGSQTPSPLSQLPAIAQPVLGTSFQLVFRFFFYSPSVTLLMVLGLSQASSTSHPGRFPRQTKLLLTQWSVWNQELRERARSLK